MSGGRIIPIGSSRRRWLKTDDPLERVVAITPKRRRVVTLYDGDLHVPALL